MIRKAIFNDLIRISEITSKAWQTNYVGIIDNDFLKTRTPENIFHRWQEAKWIENEVIDIYVFEENGFVKGFIAGNKHEQDDSCEIMIFYVDPEYQKQGIGKQLLEFKKVLYRNRGCNKMFIWTVKGFPNNEFYKKYGEIIPEDKEYTYGDKKYQGIGYIINL